MNSQGVCQKHTTRLDFIEFGNSANDVEYDAPFEPKTANVHGYHSIRSLWVWLP